MAAVRRYLAEFLSDPRVVPLPRGIWLPLLNGFVLPVRSRRSARKYASIWTGEGSPLAVHTARQAELLRRALPAYDVRYAMRYGEPAIRSALAGMQDPLVVPLYPQFAESATGSVLALLPRDAQAIRDFHDHARYIEALAANLRRHWRSRARGEMLVMSFHGLPKRLAQEYEQQCRATAALLARALALKDGEWRVTFQSRFGFAQWLQPYTQPTLVKLARAGVRRVDVVFPGFVADCLETLEEIGIVARRAFVQAGGTELRLVPCLNESPEWIEALAAMVSDRTSP